MQLPVPYRSGQKKPYGSIPRINWSHPLTRNLVSYCYDAGMGPIDLVTGGQRIIDHAALITSGNTASKYGSGLLYVGTNSTSLSAVEMPSTSGIVTLTNAAPYTFGVGLMCTVAPAGTSIPNVWVTGDATANTPVALIGNGNSGSPSWGFEFGNGTTNFGTAGALKANVFQSLLGVANSDGTTAKCYVDGKLDQSPTGLATTVVQAGVRPEFNGFGGSGAGSSTVHFDGFIYYSACWKLRALTAIEARQLHDDPWCFLIYPEDEMFATLVGVVVAAGTPIIPYDVSKGPQRVPQTQIDLSRSLNPNLFTNPIPILNFTPISRQQQPMLPFTQPYNLGLYSVVVQVPFKQINWLPVSPVAGQPAPLQAYNQSLYTITITTTLMGQAWM